MIKWANDQYSTSAEHWSLIEQKHEYDDLNELQIKDKSIEKTNLHWEFNIFNRFTMHAKLGSNPAT